MRETDLGSVEPVKSYLNALISNSKAPGIQYLALSASKVLCRFECGLADITGDVRMMPNTTMMAYSMSKTITAVAVLQLAEAHEIRLEDAIDRYVAGSPYGSSVTISQLLSHTAGVPNPIPLRWVHPADGHAKFDEGEALSAVLQRYSRLSFRPGTRFQYSNLGYWLLGKLIERVSGERFASYVTTHILRPLGATPQEFGYVIVDQANQASGYLEKYSFMNLFKAFLIDRAYVGDYEGRWLRIKSHYLNGPAFGGLVGNVQGLGKFLMDQLQPHSVLLNDAARAWLYTPQRTTSGNPIQMTLGWHMEDIDSGTFFYKEGGGAGFRSMMRVYPSRGIATIIMTNATGIGVRECLDAMDRTFLRTNNPRYEP
jgi:D-alanyl-D-alanine carboxypeptidase